MRVQRSRSSAIVVFCSPVCTPKVGHGRGTYSRGPRGAFLTGGQGPNRMAAMTTGTAPSNGIEIAYETHGDPNDEPLLLVMGLGAQLIAWPIELVDALVDRGFFVDPLRQPRRRPVDQVRRRRGRLDFMAPVHGRPRRARPCEAPYLLTDMAADGIGAARPPRHRLRPHRRRVDGRDDRADDGDRAPGAGAHAHVDHVHHRRRRRRPAHPGGDAGAAQPGRPPPARKRSPVPSRRAAIISAPDPLRRGARAQAGRGGLRPLLQPGGRRPPAARHPRLGQPGRGPGAARRPDARDPRQPSIRSSPSPAASAPPSSIPGAELLVLEDMGHDLPLPLLPQIVDAITALVARSNA